MKIAFIGKGGSGKTTLSALFCRYLASKNLPVLAIDADINQHLGTALGLTEEQARNIPPMGVEMNRIKEYLRATNPRISSIATMIKTTPPGSGSKLLRLQEDNPIYLHFQKEVDGVRLMVTGPLSEEDLGTKCYHSKVGAVELFLNHLIDNKGEYVVVDMTAGADSFASGMFTKFDLTFLVTEPTVKALTVHDQYKRYAKDYDVAIKVIGNKIENAEDVKFIQEKVGSDFLGALSRSGYVKKMEKGEYLPLEHFEPENQEMLELMLTAVDLQQKDWNRFYEQTLEFHIKNAQGWANATVGEDLTLQIDPYFSFPT
jgi:CO dehydrogenase maturation factor